METKCPRCHHRNRHPRRYCARCGSPLSRTCGACGFVNEGTEDYCGGCGNALSLGPVTAPGGRESGQPERRQLTVMFCDLVGSTVLSQELDPEDLREVIRGYQSSATQVIARYDGFVARYMGDGMLVYFGFPRAHEDDAARAIDAGLKIVESLHDHAKQGDPERGADLSVRVGIATGAVVVGDLIGEGASAEAPVVGATPNLAARLQAIAKPNTVVVAQLTRQLAGNLFDYADEGTRKLKGFDQPVRAWRVSRAGEALRRRTHRPLNSTRRARGGARGVAATLATRHRRCGSNGRALRGGGHRQVAACGGSG
jgi:class 3 adenylate cyclase